MDSSTKWILAGLAGAWWLSNSDRGGKPPIDGDPLTDELCASDGRCATIGIRNQQRSVSCANTLCTKVRVRLTGDVTNVGNQPVESATLRLDFIDGSGNVVRTLRETVGALAPGESVGINRTVEGGALELNAVEYANLVLEEWS